MIVYSNFDKVFKKDNQETTIQNPPVNGNSELDLFFSIYGGQSFSGGVYRTFTKDGSAHWNEIVCKTFKRKQNEIECFASDWLGRIFALDSARSVAGKANVIMFEPGTGQALDIPCNLSSFHEVELIDFSDAALAIDFYKKWLATNKPAPKINQCVSYKNFLFLGGADEISNLEVGDMDVYWGIASQVIVKVMSMA